MSDDLNGLCPHKNSRTMCPVCLNEFVTSELIEQAETPHTDQKFYDNYGFCPVDCAACSALDEMDKITGVSQGEVLARGITLAINAMRAEGLLE